MALDEVWFVTVSVKEVGKFLVTQTSQHSRICNLVAVQMKNWQHRPVASRIQKLVGMPTGRERARLRLAIADHATGQQVGIVKHRAIRMRDAIAQFSALV